MESESHSYLGWESGTEEGSWRAWESGMPPVHIAGQQATERSGSSATTAESASSPSRSVWPVRLWCPWLVFKIHKFITYPVYTSSSWHEGPQGSGHMGSEERAWCVEALERGESWSQGNGWAGRELRREAWNTPPPRDWEEPMRGIQRGLVCRGEEDYLQLREEPVSRKKMQGPGAKVQESQKDE